MPSSKYEKLEGRRFDRLIVERVGKPAYTKRGKRIKRWLCKCDCGNTCLIPTGNLISGNCGSCGCGQSDNGHQQRWRGCGQLSGTYWHRVHHNAKARNLEVTMTIQDAWDLYLKQEGRCVLTGLELTMNPVLHPANRDANNKQYQTASLDRIDSSRGYDNDNVRWVHKVVNKMKLNMSDAEFVQWCSLVATHASRAA